MTFMGASSERSSLSERSERFVSPSGRPATGSRAATAVPAASDPGPETDALTIGRRIRQLRTQHGLTLEQLATAVDRVPSQLSMIENGKREPKLTLLQAI